MGILEVTKVWVTWNIIAPLVTTIVVIIVAVTIFIIHEIWKERRKKSE